MDPISNQLNKIWVKSSTPPDIFQFLSEWENLTEADVVSTILVDQGHRWKTPLPIKVEGYLTELSKRTLSRESCLDLILGEFRARGLRPMAEHILEYLTRFPDLRKDLSARFGVMASANQTLNELSVQFDQDSTIDSFVSSDVVPEKPNVRYELRKVLGEGAFGKVYLGYDHDLERPVAIKFPKDERLTDSKHREKYLSEARTVASLNHPNIVPVYDIVRREDGAIYIVSKYIDGCTLEVQIRNELPSLRRASFIVASIATALDHAHHCQLVHRDVKPGNILLETSTGAAYITDFGLAIKGEQPEQSRRISGTPPYMSPEQVRGENHRLDGRSDIFSLGTILYELLTGHRPFDGDTPQEVFLQIIETLPPSPRSLNPAIPEELERICLKALSKDIEKRYSTAGGMANDLMKWQRSVKFDTLEDENGTYSHHETRSYDTQNNKAAITVAAQAANRKAVASERKVRTVVGSNGGKSLHLGKIAILLLVSAMAIAGITGLMIGESNSTEQNSLDQNSGVVEFKTTPATAMIVVQNGDREFVIGSSENDRTLRLSEGEYRVRISGDGYETLDETLSISWKDVDGDADSGKRLFQTYDLKPAWVAVDFKNIPRNTTLLHNGQTLPYNPERNGYLLAPGEYSLRFECDGYLPLVSNVIIERTTRVVELPPFKVPVVLKADRVGCQFFVDGQRLVPHDEAASIYALVPGKYQISCRCENYSAQTEVEVSPFQREFGFELLPARVLVRLQSKVDGLRVFRNKEEIPLDSSNNELMLELGTHELRFERPNYLPQSKVVSVGKEGDMISLDSWKMSVQLESAVPGTIFDVDGQTLTPLDGSSKSFALSEGIFEIQARARGYDPAILKIEVPSKEERYFFPLRVKRALSTIPEELYEKGKVVVRVNPPNAEKRELQVGERWYLIRDGLGQIDVSALDPKEDRWPYILKINGERLIRGEFTRQQLDEHGTRATLDISVPLTDEEIGRKIWLMTRPSIKVNKEQAEVALSQAITLAPSNFEIYRDRAICRFELRKYVDSERDLLVCFEHIPKDYLVQCYGALVAMELGKNEDAEKCIKEAISIRPKSTFAFIIDALLAVRRSQLAEAKKLLLQTLPMVVDNYELSISKSLLAYVLSQEGDLKALQLGREAVIHQRLAGLDVAEVELDRAKCMAVLAEKLANKDKTEAEKLLSEALRIVQDMVVDEQSPAYDDFRREKSRIRELLNKL